MGKNTNKWAILNFLCLICERNWKFRPLAEILHCQRYWQISPLIWLPKASESGNLARWWITTKHSLFHQFENKYYLDNLRAQFIKYALVMKYLRFHVISSRNSDLHRTSNSSEGGQKEGNQPCHLYLEQHLLLKLTWQSWHRHHFEENFCISFWQCCPAH